MFADFPKKETKFSNEKENAEILFVAISESSTVKAKRMMRSRGNTTNSAMKSAYGIPSCFLEKARAFIIFSPPVSG